MTAHTSYRLFLLAHGRSGDKGDTVNIGVIARRGEWYELLERELTPERVRAYLDPLGIGDVERFELANLGALNFLVHHALGGGGAMALKLDAQGKTFAQALLHMPLQLGDDVVAALTDHWKGRLPSYCVLDEAR